jgi:integrase
MKLFMHLWKRPDNGVWYAIFPGDRRRSLKTKDEATANRLFKEIKKQWLEGKIRDIRGETNVTLGKFFTEYEEWSKINQGRDTSRANILALKKLKELTGDKIRLSMLSLKHVDKLKTECRKKGNKTGAINNYIRHLRASFNKTVEWGYLKANPFANAKEEKEQKSPPLYLTSDEIPKLLAKTKDVHKRRLVVAYIYSGRRRSELVNLKWKHVDLEKEEYFIEKSKGHLSKWYPMHPHFRQVLASMPQRSEYVFQWRHPDSATHIVKEVLANAGYGHLHLHQLRHTFATLLVTEGVDLTTIGDLLGHTDRRATEIYAHVTDQRARNAIRLIKGGPVDLNGDGE